MNMSREETMNTRTGEFKDLLACQAIYNGTAKPAKKKMDMLEFLSLR